MCCLFLSSCVSSRSCESLKSCCYDSFASWSKDCRRGWLLAFPSDETELVGKLVSVGFSCLRWSKNSRTYRSGPVVYTCGKDHASVSRNDHDMKSKAACHSSHRTTAKRTRQQTQSKTNMLGEYSCLTRTALKSVLGYSQHADKRLRERLGCKAIKMLGVFGWGVRSAIGECGNAWDGGGRNAIETPKP